MVAYARARARLAQLHPEEYRRLYLDECLALGLPIPGPRGKPPPALFDPDAYDRQLLEERRIAPERGPGATRTASGGSGRRNYPTTEPGRLSGRKEAS